MSILSIQSEVVRGHVGNSAARFALQRLGHEVFAIPTVLLSHHPGHGRPAIHAVSEADISALVTSLAERFGFARCDAVLQGYLADSSQANAVRDAVIRVKRENPDALFLCDPVFGDDGGAYAKPGVAEAMARVLMPLADIVTPNRFELASLAGQRVENTDDAVRAARALGRPLVLATSIPDGQGLATLAITRDEMFAVTTENLTGVPHGTGDLLAALFLSHTISGATPRSALEKSASAVDAVIRASTGHDELQLVAAQDALVHPPRLLSARKF